MRLQFDPYFVKFILLLILSIAAMALIIGVYTPYFNSNKVLNPVFIMSSFGIDLVGAILPLVIALICSVIYFKRQLPKLPKLTYLLCLYVSFLIAFFISRRVSDGLRIDPATLSITMSAIIVAVLTPFYLKANGKSFWQFDESYSASLLLSVSCLPLSVIFLDLSYFSVFVNPIIGGNGLADAVLLSAMYSPITITFAFSIYALLLPISSLTKTSIMANKKKNNH